MPLTAAEVIAHPAFHDQEWGLPPTRSGKCEVAKGRAGGPFKLYYEVHGDGPVKVVWIMGLGAFRTAWKRQTRYFGHTHSTTYSSLVFDNRGMGLSDKPGCRYSTSEMAKDVIDIIKFLGWFNEGTTSQQRNLNVIGVSMGGMIAQEVGLLISEHINALVLTSTAPRLVRTVPFIENLRQRINMFVPRKIDVQLGDISRQLFSDEFLAEPDTENKDLGKVDVPDYPLVRDRFAAGELQKRMDKEGFTRKGFMLQAIAAGWHHKTAAQLRQLGDKVGRRRIAVLHGTKDRMITFHHAELLKQELGEGIEYRVWQGKGHVLMWEVVEEYNQFVEEFINKCAAVES